MSQCNAVGKLCAWLDAGRIGMDSRFGSRSDTELEAKNTGGRDPLFDCLDSQLGTRITEGGGRLEARFAASLGETARLFDARLDARFFAARLDARLDSRLDARLDVRLNAILNSRLNSRLNACRKERLESQLDARLDVRLDARLGFLCGIWIDW